MAGAAPPACPHSGAGAGAGGSSTGTAGTCGWHRTGSPSCCSWLPSSTPWGKTSCSAALWLPPLPGHSTRKAMLVQTEGFSPLPPTPNPLTAKLLGKAFQNPNLLNNKWDLPPTHFTSWSSAFPEFSAAARLEFLPPHPWLSPMHLRFLKKVSVPCHVSRCTPIMEPWPNLEEKFVLSPL